ncbi:unnamed protein product [Nippostrongylus brasiliensis]|uniref:SCP domain-containing protein n=1 Tax=Nippostrongylus brasiliensis TaxID=27835 RepID=A0A158R0B1_NIPBR|nr:unnamed protein product [Nippostrongylus brasiliensis]
MPSVGGYTSNMFLFLLSLVVLAKITYQAQPLTAKDIIDEINKFRTAVATGKSANNKNTFLPQSDQMFKLEANEDLAKIAMLLTMMCDDSTVQAPYSSVYYRSRKAVDKTVVDNALTYWYETAEQYMDQKATYKASLKDFAEVVYYKSTRVGCVVAPFNCTTGKLYGFACVFNNRKRGTYHNTNHSFDNCKHHSVYGSCNLYDVFKYQFRN